MKGLYQYRIVRISEESVEAEITVDRDSPVYAGHFPSNPLTPGVCQVQMLSDVLQEHLGMPLMISAARSIKFTAPHNPEDHTLLDLVIKLDRKAEDKYAVTARLFYGETDYLKFRGEFQRTT